MTDLELIYDWAKCGIHHNQAFNESKLKHSLEILESVKKSIDELYKFKQLEQDIRDKWVQACLDRDEFDEANKNLVAQCRYMTAEMKGWKERWESAVIDGDLLRTKNEELEERIIEAESDYQDICELTGRIFLPLDREWLMQHLEEDYQRFKDHLGMNQ